MWEDSVLYRAWYCASPNKTQRGPSAWKDMAERLQTEWLQRIPHRLTYVDALVVEVPQFYARGGGQAADLGELYGVLGAVTYGIPAAKHVHFLPRQWKGQVPKDVHNARVEAALRTGEKDAIEACRASLRHNVIDSVGIGLVHLGRMGRKSK